MKKIMSLLLALTMILSFGSFMASAAVTEATNATTIEPVNYGNDVYVDALYSANGSLKAANVFADNDNEIFTTSSSTDANYYLKFSAAIGNKTNNTRNTDNVWFMVEFAEEQAISAIYLDQWNDRIIDYRIFATSDDTIAAEVKQASDDRVGLSEHGGKLEWKTKNATTNKYEVSETVNYNGAYGTYTIDKLINAGALVKSGNLGGTNKITTTKNIVAFDKVKKAKYLIFVVDSVPSGASASSVVLDYIKLLSFENDTEVEFQHSPLYINYADQTKFPNVEAVITSRDSSYTAAKKGNPNVIVNSTLTDTASEFLNANVLALPSGIPTWFAIDLGEARTFGQIDIYQLRDRIKTVEVRALKDSISGDLLGGGTATTHGYFQAKTNGGAKLSENFINNYTTLITTANIYHTGNKDTVLNATSLDTPSTIVLPEEFTCRYLLIQITDLVNTSAGTPIIEVHVKNKVPAYDFEQTWDGEGSLNYTAKLMNDKATAQRMAVAVVQYKADKTIAEINISYVDVDAVSGKRFSGTIEKADEAGMVKVFAWNVSTLVPELNAYTFNIQ